MSHIAKATMSEKGSKAHMLRPYEPANPTPMTVTVHTGPDLGFRPLSAWCTEDLKVAANSLADELRLQNAPAPAAAAADPVKPQASKSTSSTAKKTG